MILSFLATDGICPTHEVNVASATISCWKNSKGQRNLCCSSSYLQVSIKNQRQQQTSSRYLWHYRSIWSICQSVVLSLILSWITAILHHIFRQLCPSVTPGRNHSLKQLLLDATSSIRRRSKVPILKKPTTSRAQLHVFHSWRSCKTRRWVKCKKESCGSIQCFPVWILS